MNYDLKLYDSMMFCWIKKHFEIRQCLIYSKVDRRIWCWKKTVIKKFKAVQNGFEIDVKRVRPVVGEPVNS